MIYKRRFLLTIALAVICVALMEAQERPVIGSYRFEIGKKSAYSSYLSPFSYRGNNYALSGYWTKMLPCNPRHLSMFFDGRVNFGDFLNPSRSARELDFHLQVQWGMEWQKRLPGDWLLGAGGSVGVYGGLLYLPRNGNNPVAAQFATGVAALCHAAKLFMIKKLPVVVADRVSLPLFGGFFCPEYGESYYEIYLGNRKNLAHFGWPGNRVGIDNLLSVTLDLGRTAMEIGYRFSMQNEQANNLTTRFFNHAFVIGVIPGGLGIKDKNRNVITPIY